ncbi:EAL domain-containing protein [Rhodobacteraceae bacterium]|nr:EAL domain-containing protein [Paracoccaceae bacterium]
MLTRDSFKKLVRVISVETPPGIAINQQSSAVLQMVERALERRDVMLAYQPVVQGRRPEQIAFYEGLLRVLDDRGCVLPAKNFIDAVENTPLGRELDIMALELGLAALKSQPNLRLSINMSVRSIGHPGWMKALNSGLAADETVAERLILEITESSAMEMPELVAVFMQDLQARGVCFALDDFGAGQTSFRYLREFYFDILKIDGQFIKDIARSPDNQVLTEALISVARHFDMLTVAENVENADDAAFLAAGGIDCMQGYHFGMPTISPPMAVAGYRPMPT